MSDSRTVTYSQAIGQTTGYKDTADVIQCRYNVCVMEQGTGDRENRGAMDI